MNEFLHRYDGTRFTTPLCFCGKEEQNTRHILLACQYVDHNKHAEMNTIITNMPDLHLMTGYNGNHSFISWSRNTAFMSVVLDIVNDVKNCLRTEINL